MKSMFFTIILALGLGTILNTADAESKLKRGGSKFTVTHAVAVKLDNTPAKIYSGGSKAQELALGEKNEAYWTCVYLPVMRDENFSGTAVTCTPTALLKSKLNPVIIAVVKCSSDKADGDVNEFVLLTNSDDSISTTIQITCVTTAEPAKNHDTITL